jgi:hypothetical protein
MPTHDARMTKSIKTRIVDARDSVPIPVTNCGHLVLRMRARWRKKAAEPKYMNIHEQAHAAGFAEALCMSSKAPFQYHPEQKEIVHLFSASRYGGENVTIHMCW